MTMEDLLRRAVPPADGELKRDLWPDMRRRLDEQTLRVSRFDWALIAAVVAAVALFPQSILPLLYHL